MPKKWFPLESNPDVMNSYASKMGLDVTQYAFTDVFSTEDWALAMVPRPVVGVVMLFPIKEASEAHRDAERAAIERDGQTISEKVYYMKQTIGNACGTVGIIHSIANARCQEVSAGLVTAGSYLDRLFTTTATMTPAERADYLEADDEIEVTHESAAAEGQSAQEEDVNTHFVCFTHVDGCLYELDGRKAFPINHGATTTDTLLEDACAVVKQFMERDPGELKFTIVALVKAAGDESGP